MVDFSKWKNSRTALGIGAAVLLGVGAAGGAGAVQATRPSVEMAPTVVTPAARLSATSGVVTVKGRVAEVFGDRFVVQDASGRAMVAAGREGRGAVAVGQPVTVQGRFDEGQLRASYIVDAGGKVAAVGPGGMARIAARAMTARRRQAAAPPLRVPCHRRRPPMVCPAPSRRRRPRSRTVPSRRPRRRQDERTGRSPGDPPGVRPDGRVATIIPKWRATADEDDHYVYAVALR